MSSDTDEELPLPPPPLAEVVPMSLQMALQGTTVEELGDLLSMETWGGLGDAERQHLCQLLPPGDPDAAVRALFSREALQLRPPPLDLFWGQLNAGDFSFEGLKRNQARELSRRRELVSQMRAHHNNTVHKLHLLRRTWSCPPPQPPTTQQRQGANHGDVLVYNKQGGGLVRESRPHHSPHPRPHPRSRPRPHLISQPQPQPHPNPNTR